MPTCTDVMSARVKSFMLLNVGWSLSVVEKHRHISSDLPRCQSAAVGTTCVIA